MTPTIQRSVLLLAVIASAPVAALAADGPYQRQVAEQRARLESDSPAMRAGAAEAVGRIGKVAPLDLGSPAEVELAFKHTDHADKADLRPFAGRRVDGYTVRWSCPDFPAWMGFTMANPPPTG